MVSVHLRLLAGPCSPKGCCKPQVSAAVTDLPLLLHATHSFSKQHGSIQPVHPQFCLVMPVLCLQRRAGSSPSLHSVPLAGGFLLRAHGLPLLLFPLLFLQRGALQCCTLISALSPVLGPTAASQQHHQSITGPSASPRQSQGKFHHHSPLCVCTSSQSNTTSQGVQLVRLIPAPAHPRAVPTGLPCPSFLDLPIGICLEICLDGPEQQITPKTQCEDLALVYTCTYWLVSFAQPLGDFNKTKMRIDEL